MDLKTLFKVSYGVYIVSSIKDNKYNGQIANTVFQVTSEPPTIAVCINKQNLTHQYIETSKIFTVSILSTDATMQFIGRFGFKSGRDIDKFKDTKHKIGKTTAPVVLDYTIGYLEAELNGSMDAGTHTLFFGKIVDAETISNQEPMTYAYYHEIKKGKSPKTAPTYIPPNSGAQETKSEVIKMSKYRCTVCDYIYDPTQGDPDSGVQPGTAFESLPDEWVCPVCGADKTQFVKEE